MLPASAVRWYWAHTTQFTQVYSGTVSPVVACEPGHYPLSAAFYSPCCLCRYWHCLRSRHRGGEHRCRLGITLALLTHWNTRHWWPTVPPILCPFDAILCLFLLLTSTASGPVVVHNTTYGVYWCIAIITKLRSTRTACMHPLYGHLPLVFPRNVSSESKFRLPAAAARAVRWVGAHAVAIWFIPHAWVNTQRQLECSSSPPRSAAPLCAK